MFIKLHLILCVYYFYFCIWSFCQCYHSNWILHLFFMILFCSNFCSMVLLIYVYIYTCIYLWMDWYMNIYIIAILFLLSIYIFILLNYKWSYSNFKRKYMHSHVVKKHTIAYLHFLYLDLALLLPNRLFYISYKL